MLPVKRLSNLPRQYLLHHRSQGLGDSQMSQPFLKVMIDTSEENGSETLTQNTLNSPREVEGRIFWHFAVHLRKWRNQFLTQE